MLRNNVQQINWPFERQKWKVFGFANKQKMIYLSCAVRHEEKVMLFDVGIVAT